MSTKDAEQIKREMIAFLRARLGSIDTGHGSAFAALIEAQAEQLADLWSALQRGAHPAQPDDVNNNRDELKQ